MYHGIAFLIGCLFAAGLTISNMTNPYKVLNFLDIAGSWDPTLLIVVASAVITTFIGYRFMNRLKKPMLNNEFYLPPSKPITKSLIIGSALFGIGWGIAGYCPGSAITALATANQDSLYFVIGMLIGSWSYYSFFQKYTPST